LGVETVGPAMTSHYFIKIFSYLAFLIFSYVFYLTLNTDEDIEEIVWNHPTDLILLDHTSVRKEIVYSLRQQQIEQICHKYSLGPQNLGGNITKYKEMEKTAALPPEMTLLHLPQRALLYCWIRKAASTSWNKIFFTLVNKKVPEQNLHEAAAFFRPKKENLQKIFSESISFTFVRHPFVRLVSAFRDKFELGAKNNYIYKMYAADILNIPEASSDKTEAYMRMIYSKIAPLPRPTFSQFVDYLLRTKIGDYNDHWLPYWIHCNFCQQRFNMVGKVETIAEDTEYIIGLTGLSEDNLQFPWANRKNTPSNVSLDYFKTIGAEKTRRLFEIYRVDFEMFGYQVDQYLR